MHNLDDDLTIFTTAMGKYIDAAGGARCCISTWRRVDDNAIPARAKVCGIYVNSALAKTEAQLAGFDEAIMLTHDGHVSEGSGENIFLVMDGRLVTPAPSENILMGITRASVIELGQDGVRHRHGRAPGGSQRADVRQRVLHDRAQPPRSRRWSKSTAALSALARSAT